MNAAQARAVLVRLLDVVDDPVTHFEGHTGDWDGVIRLAAQYNSRRAGVSSAVINDARTMTVEELVLTALGAGAGEDTGR